MSPSVSASAAVRTVELTKTYGTASAPVHALRGVSVTIERGERVALLGKSGSGKSNLLNLIGGLDRPTSGTIAVDGVTISSLSEGKLKAWRARHVGFVFQMYNLLPAMTAERNVELPLLLTSLTSARRKQQVATALSLVGL